MDTSHNYLSGNPWHQRDDPDQPGGPAPTACAKGQAAMEPRFRKHRMKLYFILICFLFIGLTSTCSHPPQQVKDFTFNLEKHRLNKFEELERSILKVTCSAYYENYYYSEPPIQADTVRQESLLQNKDFTTSSVAGTGLIIQQHLRKMVLLTCYHLFDFRDTVKVYYLDENKQPTRFLQSLSIKYDQAIYVAHKSGRRSRGEIIAMDKANDIALIEAATAENILIEPPFQGSFSKAKRIKLGKEVYLLGFPKGFFLVTKGLASPLPHKNKFMIDAPFNKGFSGGIAIAFDDIKPSYQYMGMATSTAYNSELVFAPPDDPQIVDKYQNIPYEGDIYLKKLHMINYGLTFVIKSSVIIDFLKREEERLKQMGYNSSSLIK